MFCDKNNPIKATVWMRRETQKTGLRPIISAILGDTKAAPAQPIKRMDPMKPTLALD
jgi:hypothetical protein